MELKIIERLEIFLGFNVLVILANNFVKECQNFEANQLICWKLDNFIKLTIWTKSRTEKQLQIFELI